jgi:hypothetical protein
MAEPRHGIELSAGDEFAGYRIESRLGRGGMGVLYLAIEPGLERRVALKLIAPEAAADEVFARRFAEESRIAASIEHPNVVPIYAAGESKGVPFIAMRYVAGADLSRRLTREGRLSPTVAIELIAQVGNGLDAIHAAGLIHRDVKPANVLLAGEGASEHTYITDFGVARNVATESGLTQTGRFVGTLDYVAPEQISGGPVDARADVYALGCLLFKLLTGEVPFPKEAEAARLFAHLNDPPPAPSLYVPELSMALDDVVIRAMSKDPDDRYPSAGDLGRAAQAALQGEQPTVPERTVATGAAATRTTEAIAAPVPETIEATAASGAGTAGGARFGGRRRLLIGGSVLAAAAIALTIALASGGDSDGGGGEPSGAEAEPVTASDQRSKPKPKPQTLTREALIAKADAICADSQRRYKAIRELESEMSVDVPYAESLVRFATSRVRGLRELRPPPGLAEAYGKYVAAQKRVLATDKAALAAARDEDVAGVEAARAQRDAEDAERYDLAREIGLRECSANP